MYIGYSEEQEALRKELRAYYDKLLTPEVRAELAEEHGFGSRTKAIRKQMARDGWLCFGWPEQYGGRGRGEIDHFIFFDESMRCGAPIPMLSTNTVGPTLMAFGTEEQKQFYLPKIAAGEVEFCIGYSEPGAGTDLASLQCRAELDGDEYLINGQKTWTSLAGGADYCWLAVRTDPEAPKHAGISMIIVDLKNTEGIEIQPLDLLSEHNINQVFFENARVPAKNIVGGLNRGWKLITNQLNHERVTICSTGMIEGCYDSVVAYARETELPDGRRLIDEDWVQLNLAKVYKGISFLRLINWKVAWSAEQGTLSAADASSTKVFGTEFFMDALRLMMEVLEQPGYLVRGSAHAVAKGSCETYYRALVILTFGGGTNEIQRDLIGLFGLGLPRIPRH
ncbi:MAG: acyl-CoA dehydrogenase [bacterium]|nr:acyl-CoA dehydrogenase [bacterium]MCP5066876.1 acyl-CoA dehydrogenase [bacterium]